MAVCTLRCKDEINLCDRVLRVFCVMSRRGIAAFTTLLPLLVRAFPLLQAASEKTPHEHDAPRVFLRSARNKPRMLKPQISWVYRVLDQARCLCCSCFAGWSVRLTNIYANSSLLDSAHNTTALQASVRHFKLAILNP